MFTANSLNITELLVVALALVATVFVLRRRYDSNMPLFFFVVAILFVNMTDRDLNPYLLYGGLGFALLLRFEFMGPGFAKFVGFVTTGWLCVIIWSMVTEVFG